ncbi:MAG: hypothetical protein PHI37_00620 [Candidatus Gracilibacteria bacterium]|nr:hypothetical protein [Candidatus Gracilibacteria bacterium]
MGEIISYVIKNFSKNKGNKFYMSFLVILIIIFFIISIVIINLLIFKNIKFNDYTFINFIGILSFSSFLSLLFLIITGKEYVSLKAVETESIVLENKNNNSDFIKDIKNKFELNNGDELVVVAGDYAYNMAIEDRKYETSNNRFVGKKLKGIIFYNNKNIKLLGIVNKESIPFKHEKYGDLQRFIFSDIFELNIPYIGKGAMVQSYKYINFEKLEHWIEKGEIKQGE